MKKTKPERLERIGVDVPPELHTEFKLKTVKKGVSMSEIVRSLILFWIKTDTDPNELTK